MKIVDLDNVELDSLIGGNTPGDVTSLNCDLGPWASCIATFDNSFQLARKKLAMKRYMYLFGYLVRNGTVIGRDWVRFPAR